MNHTESELHLNAAKTALVVIDLQNGIAHGEMAPHSPQTVIGNAVRLAETCAAKGAFVVFVRVSSLDGKDMLHPLTDLPPMSAPLVEGFDAMVPELAQSVPAAHLVTKRQWGAFHGTDLDLQLRRRGIDTIVLCGISTSIGVDTTAREAYQLGYQQVFVEDAMTARKTEEHAYVCGTIFPRIGRIRSTAQVCEALR